MELMLRILQAIASKLGQGEQIGSGLLNGIMEFLSIFVDKCHHGKEDEFHELLHRLEHEYLG